MQKVRGMGKRQSFAFTLVRLRVHSRDTSTHRCATPVNRAPIPDSRHRGATARASLHPRTPAHRRYARSFLS
jgi:hypothetical protein